MRLDPLLPAFRWSKIPCFPPCHGQMVGCLDSRVAVILPSDPICDHKIGSGGNDEECKIFVVGIVSESIENLNATLVPPETGGIEDARLPRISVGLR